ncbi:hypothetical protein OH799_11105 [Nocardia sp. NBC_00881]|uniref:hypothetical protein n=1 Tax=Nocardia sp. NBC_00881 TaxID=2975995 RepID=UPI00386A5E64|nr:hypothetical protein OH799_11105 [Nocardia sp. NBC_00881]
MNADIITPLTPDATASIDRGSRFESSAHAAFPLVELVYPTPPRENRWTYGLRRVDRNGRVIDKSVVAALGWCAGLRLCGMSAGGGVRLTVCESGKNRITSDRDLRLAARTRRALAIAAGDQVLLVADTQQMAMTVLPLRAVDRLVGEACEDNHAESGQS